MTVGKKPTKQHTNQQLLEVIEISWERKICLVIFFIFVVFWKLLVTAQFVYEVFSYYINEIFYTEPNYALCVGNNFCPSRARKEFLAKNSKYILTPDCHPLPIMLQHLVLTFLLYCMSLKSSESSNHCSGAIRSETWRSPPFITLQGFYGDPSPGYTAKQECCHFLTMHKLKRKAFFCFVLKFNFLSKIKVELHYLLFL